MKFFVLLKGTCVLILLSSGLFGQDAQAIIDSAAKVYTETPSYAAQVDSRTLHLVFAPQAEGEAPRYDVQSTRYQRLQIRVRRPHGFWLAAQSHQHGRPLAPMGRFIEGGRPESSADQSATWSVMAREDDGDAKQGIYVGTRFMVQNMPPDQFNRVASSRMGERSTGDFVLRHFQADGSMPEGTLVLGLIDPEIIGREAFNGRPVFRITAKTSGGDPVMLWIEQQTFLIVRSIVHQSPDDLGVATMAPRPRRVVVVETLYNNQQAPAAFLSGDFMVGTPPPTDQPNASKLGFCAVAELVRVGGIAPGAIDADALAATEDVSPVVTSAPEPTPAPLPSVIPAQALSYEQMSGIVLIDGDGGTATGFMTKIRDVDFVVTNLHVLVGNRKVSIKTLRGDEVPIQGIFGAVGGDVAIIRIPKGEGELRLATDVFQTSKIGDRVVVVGNRRGGGVATQTNGSIKGIGPRLIEVDANFQPGNSGSPIVNLDTNEVVGVATYSETRQVEVESANGRRPGPASSAPAVEVEKRWFGNRLDSVSKWEAIDLGRWNDQGERIDTFRELSEALVSVIKFDLGTARQNPRLASIIDNFNARYRLAGRNSMNAATEVKDLFRVIRTISEDGVRDLTTGDYYDYYRSCEYWENSIPAQLDYRKRIVEVLKKYETNSNLYLSRMRGGS